MRSEKRKNGYRWSGIWIKFVEKMNSISAWRETEDEAE
jgi:hypothetical protein